MKEKIELQSGKTNENFSRLKKGMIKKRIYEYADLMMYFDWLFFMQENALMGWEMEKKI
jgi:hypothetical protein